MKFKWAKNKKKNKNRRNPNLMDGQDDYVFRRSRTITGTKVESVAASAPARGRFKTDRIKLIELRARRSKILRSLSIAAVVICFIAFVIINIIPTRPSVKGVQGALLDGYQQSINKYLNTHPLERLTFLLQQQELLNSVAKDYPEVKTLSFSHDWYGGNTNFDVVFRTPLIAWNTGDKKFYVDANGIAFTYNNFVEPPLEVIDQSGLSPDQSGAVASSKFIRFLGQIVSAVNSYNKGAVASVIIPPAAKELDIKLQGRECVIRTNTDRDPLQEAEDINSALDYFDKRGISPPYIDVRVAHKAFYK